MDIRRFKGYKMKSMYRNMELKLLECPFCGSEPILVNIGNKHTKKRTVKIKCSNKLCRCQIINSALIKSMDWTEDTSVESWNRRSK